MINSKLTNTVFILLLFTSLLTLSTGTVLHHTQQDETILILNRIEAKLDTTITNTQEDLETLLLGQQEMLGNTLRLKSE